MNIKILGNGGAINNGLPYNSFIIDEALLCETPPDIMLSLSKNNISISKIKTIYISHLHGDHIFGLPFLMLSACLLHAKENQTISYKIFGPAGIQEMAENLLISAFTSDHPSVKWMREFCNFEIIDEHSSPDLLSGYETSIFKLEHLVDTYGFSMTNKNVQFAYVADTIWCESVKTVLDSLPQIVLIDLNGEDNEPNPVHISRKDLIEKGLPITGEKTVYYGTHLKEEFISDNQFIKCTNPGMVIEL